MDIAAMSTISSQANLQQEVSISVMKLAMDSVEAFSDGIAQMAVNNSKVMEQSVNPHLGGNIDLNI